MESYLIYFGKSALAAGVFYIAFLLLFQNQKHFVFNRFYLPVSLALSFLIPLITFTTVKYVEPVLTVNNNSFAYLANATESVVLPEFVFQWYHYLFGLYILGVAGFMFHLLLGHVKAMNIIRFSRLKMLFGAEVNITLKDVHPFSFFNKIVISENTLDSPNLKMIVNHENIHVKEKHTLDILFVELLFLAQWFNPFAWLIKDAVKNNLEYKTDHQITKTNNPKDYQLAMVALADKQGVAPFLTALNGSQLKNRIIMMKKKTENKYTFLKQLVVLPLLAILVMGLSNKEIRTEIVYQETENNVKGKVISRENEMPVEGVGIYNKFGNKLAASDNNGDFEFSFEEEKDNIIFVKEGFQPKHREVDLTEKKEANVTVFLEVQINVEDKQEVIERIVLDYKLGEKSVGQVSHNPEEWPEFPGGESALIKFIADNIDYPEDALENGIWGDAYVTFIIDKNGKVRASRISRGIHPSLDEEALRTVNSFPDWEPGTVNGENVNVWYTVPIKFGKARITKNRVYKKSKAGTINKHQIKGKVTDEKGNPISGASILIKGKQIGTISDSSGNYKLKLDNENETLIFIMMGFEKLEIPVDNKNEINIKLNSDRSVSVGTKSVTIYTTYKHAIKGKITDQNGNPISGASILIKGKPVGTITDSEGNYEIRLDEKNEILIFSKVGFEKQEIKVEDKTEINIKLKADKNTKPDETKVQYYGTQIKPTVVNSHVKASKTLFLDSIKNENSPIYIVDGKEIEDVNSIHPDDVESISILKNKSATAIYGEKGKNGVILISTKKNSGDLIFNVEEMPQFPGGELALKKYIKNSVRYPETAKENGIKGKVYVTFIIDKNGKVTNSRISRGVAPILDKEAQRVVNLLPLWKPGKQGGKPVDVSYTVPVLFGVQDEVQMKEKPLIVIDGIISGHKSIDDIDPETLKAVNILKGEAATEKYGEKGKNGVIEIILKAVNITSELQLRKFIAKEIKYPVLAHKAKREKVVKLSVQIDKKGNITSISETEGYIKIRVDEVVIVGNKIKEVVVTGYGTKVEAENARKIEEQLLIDETKRVIKKMPTIDIPELKGKTVGIRVKFVLQD